MRLLSDTEANKKGKENANYTRRHVHKGSLLGQIPQVFDEGGRVGCDDSTGNRQLKSKISEGHGSR